MIPGRRMDGSERVETVIIGGGQAGLSTGYHLARRGLPFVILDANERIGDAWRSRWDSLRLFSPARYDGLEGMPFPASAHSFPTKDEMADYLEAYAARFELPIRTGVRVDSLDAAPDGPGYVVRAGDERFEAGQVVVASGAFQDPRIPDFAEQLDPTITQLHSSAYRNTSQLQSGGVLVVGASNSGGEIALDVARDHETWLSGRDTGQMPFEIEGRVSRMVDPLLWLVLSHVLTIRTPMGRKASPLIRGQGGPLERVRPKDLEAAGVHRVVGRTVGVRDGRPLLDDGQVPDVRNVIWATGFTHGYPWIRLPIIGADGYPIQARGVVPSAPGLYFVGLPFQYAFISHLLGGVGRDAGYVVDRIMALAAQRAAGDDRRQSDAQTSPESTR